MNNTKILKQRYLARFIIEAETPLAVGSGRRDILTDSLVVTDANGLPYIPGTALVGVLRNSLSVKMDKGTFINLFGYSEQDVRDENRDRKEQDKDMGKGSRLILSSAQIVGYDGKVIDGLQKIDFENDFFSNFNKLPVRQHVRISHTGAAEQKGKFDEQIVFKGTRFCFEIELVGNENDQNVWKQLLLEFSNPTFRIGGGTRKGFGEISVKEVKSEVLNLEVTEMQNRYLNKTSNLNDSFWEKTDNEEVEKVGNNWIEYELKLIPENFFFFGSGFGNEDGTADMSFVTEKIIKWRDGTGKFSEEKILIPATSVKGALTHRTAFYFNKSSNVFADKVDEVDFCDSLIKKGYRIPDGCNSFNTKMKEDIFKMITDGNPAVLSLFGYSAGDNDGQRGNILFSDIFLSDKNSEKQKLLNHVAIDRFTGGAREGALFSEEVTASKEQFILKISVINNSEIKEDYVQAFELALKDLCTGMLPLGGGTMRGHGCFSGELFKNGKIMK